MKKLYLLAAAALTLAACTDEAYLGENKEFTKTDNPIGFNMSTPAMSRADMTGKTAADALKDSFFVYGIKNEAANIGTIKSDGTDPNNVMNNYVVTYAENSAMTTTSNTEGWEYVGNALTTKQIDNVKDNAGAAVQTIKYWDWGATDYTFTAISAPTKDVELGAITITKTNDNTTSVYKNGYVLKFKSITTGASGSEVNNVPDVASVYIADRENIVKSNNEDRTKHNTYGGQVNFTFRSLGTKVRAAMYETVPGYTVTIDKMYGNGGVEGTTNFVADCKNSSMPTNGSEMTATVTYYDNTKASVENQPTVTFSDASDSETLTLGTNLHGAYTDASSNDVAGTTIGESITTATYDKSDKGYTFVLPQEANEDNLVLTVDYTLTCTATGEKITVEGAKATVPYEYLQWKPNFSYTYMFKISDNTNGHTGPTTDPAGLYPITFDAVVVDAGDGIAEYITTVSDPTITTFGVKGGKYVADATAYAAGTDIYATVVDGGAVKDLTASGKTAGSVNLYTVTTSDATNFPITEAAVAEVIYETANGTLTGTPKLTVTPLAETTDYEFVTKVPGEDGVDIDPMNALKWTAGTSGTYYAVEYITVAETPAVPAQYSANPTADTTIDDTKTYYTRSGDEGSYVYTPVESPVVGDITDYYEQTQAPQPLKPAKAQYKVVVVK